MTDEENNFDELIRNKLEQRKFEPRSDSWTKAEKLIEQDKTRKKRFGFYGKTALITGIIALLLLPFYFFPTTDEEKDTLAVENSRQNESAAQTANELGDKIAGSDAANAVNPLTDDQKNNARPDPDHKLASSQYQDDNNSITENKNETGITVNNSGTYSPAKPVKSSSPSTSIADKKPVAGHNVDISTNSVAGENTSNLQPPVEQDAPVTAHASIPPGQTLAQEKTAEQPASGGQMKEENQNIATGNKPVQQVPVMPIVETTAPVQQETVTQTAETPATGQTANTSATDSSKEIVELPPANVPNSGVNFWFAEAGLGFVPRFSPADYTGRSFNPVVGAGYHLHLFKKFALHAGLQYTWINNASDSSKVYTSSNYSFGVENQHIEIGLRRLHYAAVPLMLWWHPNAKNAFFAGATINYMFTTESVQRSYIADGPTVRDENIKSTFGYDQGINRFDVLASAGYGRNFGSHWNANVSAYYGFMDIKQNTWYGVNQFERNSGFRLMLQYQF